MPGFEYELDNARSHSASPTDRPCDNNTSTWRSFATISSGLCFFWGIPTSSYGSIAYFRENHFFRGQTKATRRLGVTQPRISDLSRGKINLFGPDSLVNIATAAGLHVEMQVHELEPA